MLGKWDKILNKKIVQAVLERSKGLCEYCLSPNMPEIHHILRRKVEADEYNCIMLCYEHHRGNEGPHGKNGRQLDLKLKLQLQEKYFDMGYSEETVREMMGGKLYIGD